MNDVVIKVLQEGKMRRKKVAKKKWYINLCAVHQCLQIGCKLRLVRP
jgi:hypothetical protein